VWESSYAGFRSRGIPLVHQLAVAGPFRRRGVASLLMDAAERLARDRGIATLGITVGVFDEYGPAQRLYGRRGYIPDGRGACHAQRPLRKGMQVTMDDDLHLAHQGSRRLTPQHRTSAGHESASRCFVAVPEWPLSEMGRTGSMDGEVGREPQYDVFADEFLDHAEGGFFNAF